MSVPASSVFAFTESLTECEVVRHEFRSGPFSALRRSIRFFVRCCQDDESFSSTARSLHLSLVNWLSCPVNFSEFDATALQRVGTPEEVLRRWGDGAVEALDTAHRALTELRERENPVRSAVVAALAEHAACSKSVRIYCHPKCRDHFVALPGWVGGSHGFIHNWRGYRDVVPFDALIYVGPLRARGIVSLPPAVLNAPRQRTVLQFVWAGLDDDRDFGRDPVMGWLGNLGAMVNVADTGASASFTPNVWVRTCRQSADDDSWPEVDEDDLQVLQPHPSTVGMRRALLIRLSRGCAALYAPRTCVIVARRDESRVLCLAVAAEEIGPGDWLVRPRVEDVDFGGVTLRDGRYATAWKTRLEEAWRFRRSDIEHGLKERDVALEHLGDRVQWWCRQATTVIHAPQQREHFRVLIEVLGIEEDRNHYPRPPGVAWWRLAWREIAHSRGEAIQAGLQGHGIINDQIVAILNGPHSDLLSRLSHDEDCEIDLPPDSGLSGFLQCWPVEDSDENYHVPESLLGAIIPLQDAFEWRV